MRKTYRVDPTHKGRGAIGIADAEKVQVWLVTAVQALSSA